MRSYDCCNLTTALLNFDYNVMIVSLTFETPQIDPPNYSFLLLFSSGEGHSQQGCRVVGKCNIHVTIIKFLSFSILSACILGISERSLIISLIEWLYRTHIPRMIGPHFQPFPPPIVILTRQTHLRVYLE